MATSSRMDHLKGLALLSRCNNSDLRRIADVATERTVPAGHQFVEQGSMPKEAYVVVSGTAEVRRGSHVIAEVGPGAPIGELALLDRGPRTAHVVALTDMELIVIPGSALEKLLADVPSLARALLEHLAHEVRELNREAFDS